MDTKIGISFEPLGVGGLNFRVFLSLYVPVSGASMEGIENFWWSILIFLNDLEWNDPYIYSSRGTANHSFVLIWTSFKLFTIKSDKIFSINCNLEKFTKMGQFWTRTKFNVILKFCFYMNYFASFTNFFHSK